MTAPSLLLLLASQTTGFFLRPEGRPVSYQPPGQRKGPLSLTSHLTLSNYRPSVSPSWTPLTDTYGPPNILKPPSDSYGPPKPQPPPRPFPLPPPSDSYGPPRPVPFIPPLIIPPRPVIPVIPSIPKPNFNLLRLFSSKLARIWALKSGILRGIISFNPFIRPSLPSGSPRPPRPSYKPPGEYEVQIDPPKPSYRVTTKRPVTSTTTLYYNNVNSIVQPGQENRFPGESIVM